MFEKAMEALWLTPRAQQIRLVEIVRVAFATRSIRFAQAGTGTGKSFVLLAEGVAYAKQTGLPVIVICPNNTLIDQYVRKDGPCIAEALDARIEYLKGRGRYVCSNSIAGHATQLPDETPIGWFNRVTDGQREIEWAELGLTDEYACPGSRRCKRPCLRKELHCPRGCKSDHDHVWCDCPYPCGILIARDRAQSADVVITNAHLLVWDARLRQWTDDTVCLLPDRSALLVDECHELEQIGRDVFSVEIAEKSRLWKMWLGIAAWRQEQIESMVEGQVTEVLFDPEDPANQDVIEQAREHIVKYDPESDEYERIESFLDFASPSDSYVQVIRLGGTDTEPQISLHKRCVDLSWFYARLLGQQPSVLTSGTIPSSDKRRLGVQKAKLELVGHPFDYSRTKLYISPNDARDPGELPYRIATAVRAIKAVYARGGGTLMLFTSWRELDDVSARIAAQIPEIPIWTQGREHEYQEQHSSLRQDVFEWRANGAGVLCGVRSLFTGLDIPGPALSQVIVWKLPYAVPDAEVQAIQALHGRSVYKDQMIMQLVQGIGRLIRTTEDTGNVLIMDNRASSIDFTSNHMTHHLVEFERI